jgi:8-oxo-dGTP pyrophosphatase MutT (NUDIX family)
MKENFIPELQRKLRQPLPGPEAQLKMAHATRWLYQGIPEGAKQAAVLAALFQKNSAWHVVLIERNRNDNDRHGGQISFPGGKFEPGDENLLNTAVREAEEEVGILRNQVKILGALSDLYIPVSNFQVHPFVGWLESPPEFRIQEKEVDGVLEVPLAHFLTPGVRRATDIRVSTHLTMKNVPYFDVDGKILWGATAMIINELMEVIGMD